MRGKRVIQGMVVILVLLVGTAWAEMAVPISPGGGTEMTGQSCPTFSWSAAPGAFSYSVEVYEQMTGDPIRRNSLSETGKLVVAKEIPAPALSWTPSSGECLARGMKYVWYVRGVDAEGEGQWSGGLGFQVETAALSIEQQAAVQEVVKGYLTGDGTGEGATSGTIDKGSASSVITPMYDESASNSLFGNYAGGSITDGMYDTFIGAAAGFSTTTGASNSFLGSYAGYSNISGYNNSFLGSYTGYSNTSGYNNSFLGNEAGRHNTTGYSNSFLGRSAGYTNDKGNTNTFLGAFAGYYNIDAVSNSFIGSSAGFYHSAGNSNIFIGNQTGYYNTTGSSNVFLGSKAGYNETGSNKLYIDNCYTVGTCTQPLIYGEFDNRLVRIDGRLEMVTVATPSDIRYKKEIQALESPLEKVMQLQGVTYEWDKAKVKGAGFTAERQIGLIAQEVEKILPELVHTDSKGYKTLSYDKLGPVLIEAMKEQQNTITQLENALEDQKKSLASQQAMIKAMMTRMAALENPAKTLALK